MIDVGVILMLIGAVLVPTACTIAIAMLRVQRLERERLRRDHRIHVIVDRTRASLQPQGNGGEFSPLAERTEHDA